MVLRDSLARHYAGGVIGRPVTIVDIARELGISKTTVSSALHGNGRVSESTREQVSEAAERLGYVSNQAAQRLRGSKSQSIGLHLFPNSHARNFYMQFVFGVMEHAADLSLDLTVLTENRWHPRRRSLWADGILVLDPAPNDPFIAESAKAGVPLVAVGALSPDQRGLVRGQYSGGQDLFTGPVLDQLQAEGVRRPAIVTLSKEFAPLWAQEVLDIYLARMQSLGVQPLVLQTSFWPSAAELDDMVEQLGGQEDVDGLLVVQQGVAGPLARRYQQRHGRSLWVAALAADPVTEQGVDRLMSVELNAQSFGRKAAKMLTDFIDAEDAPNNGAAAPEFDARVNHEISLLVPGRSPLLLLPEA